MPNINTAPDEGIKLDGEILEEQVTSIASSQEEAPASTTSTYKLGEKEYTQEELAKLVSLGSTAAEMESRYNTSFDKAWSQYGKTVNENQKLKNELENLKKNQTTQTNNISPDEEYNIKAAREAAKRLGIVLDDDIDTKISSRFEELYQARRQQEELGQRLLDEGKALEKQLDGSDGRPAFKTANVMNYMREQYEVNPKRELTLERAYKEMYQDEIDRWRDQRFESLKKPGVTTTQGSSAGASKQPTEVKVTKDNIEQLVREELFRE